jgi:hypothetical protein
MIRSRARRVTFALAALDMEPHNIFDYNPLGGLPKCGN